MGNFQFGYNFVEPDTITASEEAVGFSADNLIIYNHGIWHWRSDDITGEKGIVLDYGSAQALTDFLITGANFASATIQGNATDSWGSPSFTQAITLTQQTQNRRYNHWASLSGFNYQFLRIKIDVGATVDSATYYRISKAVSIDTTFTLTRQPSWGYRESANIAYGENKFDSGAKERVKLGEKKWMITFSFDPTDVNNESDLWTLNDIAENHVNIAFFKNDSDNSEAGIFKRAGDIEVIKDTPTTIKAYNLKFEEVY
jgi:hypothetical protein